MMFPCVGLARSPLSFMATHRSHAVVDSGVSLMITAFNNPRPRTSSISVHSLAIASICASISSTGSLASFDQTTLYPHVIELFDHVQYLSSILDSVSYLDSVAASPQMGVQVQARNFGVSAGKADLRVLYKGAGGYVERWMSCGIDANRGGHCWGDSRVVQYIYYEGDRNGDGTLRERFVPKDYLWDQISSGVDHVCGLSVGQLSCHLHALYCELPVALHAPPFVVDLRRCVLHEPFAALVEELQGRQIEHAAVRVLLCCVAAHPQRHSEEGHSGTGHVG